MGIETEVEGGVIEGEEEDVIEGGETAIIIGEVEAETIEIITIKITIKTTEMMMDTVTTKGIRTMAIRGG